jgi:hypothetical protein
MDRCAPTLAGVIPGSDVVAASMTRAQATPQRAPVWKSATHGLLHFTAIGYCHLLLLSHGFRARVLPPQAAGDQPADWGPWTQPAQQTPPPVVSKGTTSSVTFCYHSNYAQQAASLAHTHKNAGAKSPFEVHGCQALASQAGAHAACRCFAAPRLRALNCISKSNIKDVHLCFMSCLQLHAAYETPKGPSRVAQQQSARSYQRAVSAVCSPAAC